MALQQWNHPQQHLTKQWSTIPECSDGQQRAQSTAQSAGDRDRQ